MVEDDAALWQRQREHQRSTGATVVKVSGLPADLPKALRAADALGGTLVGRAALGLWWITLPGGAEAVQTLREALTPAPCVVADAPEDVRNAVDPWHTDAGEPLGAPAAGQAPVRPRRRLQPRPLRRASI